MRKGLFIMAAILAAGCSPVDSETGLQSIRIGFEGVRSGNITKTQQSAILEAITATFPTDGITFTLTSTKAAERT